jgi:hypothetical protein
LVEIDLHEQNYDGVLNWVNQGRSHYSVEFENPWIRYAAISSLLATEQLRLAKKELGAFGKWYEKDEPWHVLSRAAVESAVASGHYLRGRLAREGENS